MRAAILLLPFAGLAAAYSAAAPQTDPYGDNVQADVMTVTNFVDVPEAEPLPENDSMDMPMEMNAAVDMDMATNSTAPPPTPRPAWMGGNMWLIAGEERSTIFWYFAPFESDFTVTPHRVVLRADETADAASPHNNTARLAEIDCAANRYRIVRTTHYDDAGNATEANERGDGSMMPVRRGTVFEYVANTICHHADSQRRQDGRQETTFNGM